MREGRSLDERDDMKEMSAFVCMSDANMNRCRTSVPHGCLPTKFESMLSLKHIASVGWGT